MQEWAIRVTEIGWKARRIVDGASAATVVAALSRSLYLDVAGELVWLGPPGSTLHGRAIVADVLPMAEAHTRIDVAFDLSAAREWRPPVLSPSVSVDILRDAARRLVSPLDRLGAARSIPEGRHGFAGASRASGGLGGPRLGPPCWPVAPQGFGALLFGRRPAFPLDRAMDDARGLLAACARDDATAATTIAERLLGLGPGLTPAGDDLIGGAFFAKLTTGTAWGEATAVIRARAAERTHRISAVLLGDLLDGDAYAPLHDLTGALARDDAGDALDAATRLIRIGHSSGWDMLTGYLGALDVLPIHVPTSSVR